ncbi:MAG: hypothetical protein AAF634_00505 [Bacteroidota bacterium]
MKKKTLFLTVVIPLIAVASTLGQNDTPGAFSIESNALNWFSNGYSLGGYYFLPNTKISLGVGIEGLRYTDDNLKETAFENGDLIDEVQLDYLARVEFRYHFKEHHEGFYAGVRAGFEEWTLSLEDSEASVENGFVSPTIGYIWHPWGKDGLMIHPFFAGIFILGDGEATLGQVNINLNGFLPNPGIAIGFKF